MDFSEKDDKRIQELFQDLQKAQFEFDYDGIRKAHIAIGDIIHENCVAESIAKCRKREGRGWISMYEYKGERRDKK